MHVFYDNDIWPSAASAHFMGALNSNVFIPPLDDCKNLSLAPKEQDQQDGLTSTGFFLRSYCGNYRQLYACVMMLFC